MNRVVTPTSFKITSVIAIFFMFLAAAREHRGEKRRSDTVESSDLYVDSNRELHLGSIPPSRYPMRKSIEVVYPEFASLKLADIIRIADLDIEKDDIPSLKRFRQSETISILEGDESVCSPVQSSPKPEISRISSLSELIAAFPRLQQMIDSENERQARSRIPLEFVQEYEKPTQEIKPVVVKSTESTVFSNIQNTTSDLKEISAGFSTPTEPVIEVQTPGGGLLAGIDDIFGSSKKTKAKSSRR